MKDSLDVQIGKVVRSEVGSLEGASDVLVLRIEQKPLVEDHPDHKPAVAVFILDRTAADSLRCQLGEALARINVNKFRIEH